MIQIKPKCKEELLHSPCNKYGVGDAKRSAEQASKIAGFRLGRIINYKENSEEGFPRPYAVGAVGLGTKDASPTQVEPGSSEVKVMVTLSYEIQ